MAAGGDGESGLQCLDTFTGRRKKTAVTRTVVKGGRVSSARAWLAGTTATQRLGPQQLRDSSELVCARAPESPWVFQASWRLLLNFRWEDSH